MGYGQAGRVGGPGGRAGWAGRVGGGARRRRAARGKRRLPAALPAPSLSSRVRDGGGPRVRDGGGPREVCGHGGPRARDTRQLKAEGAGFEPRAPWRAEGAARLGTLSESSTTRIGSRMAGPGWAVPAGSVSESPTGPQELP